jgi:hypothetical protein
MIRNFKVLGVVLAAVFAMSAVAASAASAQIGAITSDGPFTLKSVETGAAGSGSNALTAFGGRTECPGTVITGHKYNVTPHTFIESGATTVTGSFDFPNPCKTTLGSLENAPTTVDLNGCDLALHVGETTGGVAGTYGVTATEVCPGTHIQVTVFSSSAHSLRICTLTTEPIAGKEEISGGHLTNTGETSPLIPDDFDISGTFGPFKVVKSGLCGAATTEEGKLDVDATVQGYNETGNLTGVTVTHN